MPIDRLLLLAVPLVCLGAVTAAQAQVGPPSPDGPFAATVRGAELAEALEQLVELTGIDLIYGSELVAGRHSYCSTRDASAEELLGCMLDGTGVDFVRSSSGAYVLIVARKQRPPAAHITGRVVDAESGQPMPLAHVLLADAATVADSDGQFAFGNLPPGRHELVATFVGYEPSRVIELWVMPGATERVTVELQPAQTRIAPIVIDGLTQRLPSAALGFGEASVENAAPSVMSGTPDVMRGAAATMGVSTALPLADLHIQGGNAAEHVTRLDGVPVRDPVALGRYLGAFSPLAIGAVHVHKAGFGVEHGSLLSGAIDLRHDLSASSFSAALQADPLSVNARVSAPVEGLGGGGGSALVAVRKSAWGMYHDRGVAQLLARASQVDPLISSYWLQRPVEEQDLHSLSHAPRVDFSDIHAALRFRPDEHSTLSASLFRAGNFVAADQTILLSDAGTDQTLSFSDLYDWSNWAGQIRYSRILDARSVVSARLRGSHHASLYEYSYETDYEDRPPFGSPATQVRESSAAHLLTELGADVDLAVSLAPGADVDIGLAADYVDAHFAAGNAVISPFTIEAAELLLSGHLRGSLSLGRRTVVEGGSRLVVLPSSGQFFAEPRAAVRYDGALAGTDGYAVRLAAGLYRQFVSGYPFRSAGPASLVPELWFWLPTTPDVPHARAGHLALDGIILLPGGLTLRAETFARFEPEVLALDVEALRLRDAGQEDLSPSLAVSHVRGRALGGGIGIQWQHRRAYASASYSFEHARRSSLLHEGGGMLPVPWEEPHRVSIAGNVDVGAGVSLAAAARGIWGRSWGFRQAYYEYLTGPAGPPDGPSFDHPEDDRLPPYLVVDATATYRLNLAGANWRLEAGVANLLDRENVVDWSIRSGEAGAAHLPRLLPGRRLTFSLRVDL